MKKKLVCILAAVMAVTSFAACGSNSGNAAGADTTGENDSQTVQSNGGSSDSSSLVMAWWGNQTRNERTQSILDMYAEENPGVTIEGQFSEFNDYWNKLATAAAGHSMPDIVQMDYKYLQQYVNNDLLVDLTPYIEDGTIDVSNCNQDVLNSAQADGGLYALCNGINAPALLYNKTLLDENGITVKDNMTMPCPRKSRRRPVTRRIFATTRMSSSWNITCVQMILYCIRMANWAEIRQILI